MMANLLKLVFILIEWSVQLRRRDDEEVRRERLEQARDHPGDYLRRFGRVRRDEPAEGVEPKVRGDPSSVE